MTWHNSRLREWFWRGIYAMWPLTYAILAIDDLTRFPTLQQGLKQVFTLDLLMALMWPVTWTYWIVQAILLQSSPLSRLLGF